MSFAGWLWADLLLGLFAIFALATSVGQVGAPASVATSAPPPSVAPAVSAAPVAQAAPRPIGLAPNPLEMTLPVDGPAILSGDPRRASVEQSRVAAEVARAIGEKRVALVLAYGSHADARAGTVSQSSPPPACEAASSTARR